MLQDMVDYLEARVGLHGLDDERYHTNIPKHLRSYVTPEEWSKSSIRLLESVRVMSCVQPDLPFRNLPTSVTV